MLVIRWKKNFELVNSVLETWKKHKGYGVVERPLGLSNWTFWSWSFVDFVFPLIPDGSSFRPSFRPISLNWLFDQESAPVPKQTKTATMKVLYVLDVQQLHTFDELSISFAVSRAIIQVHMFLAEGLIIQDVKPINSVCLGNPWNHSAIWPVVLLWPFGLVGSFALSAVKDATFGGWEAWSVESRWDQGWCRVELYDLYTFSEQDRSDFDGFCIMYLWKCQTF